MNCKIFSGSSDFVEKNINEFFRLNKNIIIVDIRYSTVQVNEDFTKNSVIIIYNYCGGI